MNRFAWEIMQREDSQNTKYKTIEGDGVAAFLEWICINSKIPETFLHRRSVSYRRITLMAGRLAGENSGGKAGNWQVGEQQNEGSLLSLHTSLGCSTHHFKQNLHKIPC